MMVSKILMSLPAEYQYLVTAWEPSPADKKNLENLIDRLMLEQSRNKCVRLYNRVHLRQRIFHNQKKRSLRNQKDSQSVSIVTRQDIGRKIVLFSRKMYLLTKDK